MEPFPVQGIFVLVFQIQVVLVGQDDGSQEIVRMSNGSSNIPNPKVGSTPCLTIQPSQSHHPNLVQKFS